MKISGVPTTDKVKDGDDLNVVVIYEATPVLYDKDGTPYADWKQAVIVDNETEGGNS